MDGSRMFEGGETLLREPAAEACYAATCRYLLRAVATKVDTSGGDATAAFVMVALVEANILHLIREPDASRPWADFEHPVPDSERRPATGVMLSQRLGLPRETVRRRLNALAEMGRCAHVDDGYIVPQAVVADDARRDAANGNFAALLRLARDFTAAAPELCPPNAAIFQPASGGVAPIRAANRLCCRFALDFARPLADLCGGYEEALIYMALLECARPGAGPRTVSGLGVAQSIERPTESVRRRMGVLVERGLATRDARGFFARLDMAAPPELRREMRRNVHLLQQFFDALARHEVRLG